MNPLPDRKGEHTAPIPVGGALAALSLCMLLPSLGTSIANVALPTLAKAFGAPVQHVQWVVLAYLLATTSLIVGAGRLGDLVGRRRLMVGGLLGFTASSALCAMAPGLGWLIAARALQGVGAAVVMALAMAFVADAIPKSRTGQAMGLLGAMSSSGTALGPALGGLLIARGGWPSVFWAGVPLGVAAALLVHRCLPADRPAPVRARFDLTGTALLAGTLAAWAVAMTLGQGRFGAVNAALLCVAVAGLALFVRVEARASAPLIRLAQWRDPSLRASLVTSALVATVMMSTLMVGPFHLAGALQLGAAQVGLAMSAGPVVAALAGVPAGRLVDRFGAASATAGGLGVMLAGCIALCGAPVSLGVAGYVLPLCALTAGYALFQAANNTAVMAGLAPDERGATSGLLNLARNLGFITGASAMGALFAAFAGSGPSAGLRGTFAVAALLLVAALAVVRRSRRPQTLITS